MAFYGTINVFYWGGDQFHPFTFHSRQDLMLQGRHLRTFQKLLDKAYERLVMADKDNGEEDTSYRSSFLSSSSSSSSFALIKNQSPTQKVDP